MFLQNKFVQSTKDMSNHGSSGIFSSTRVRHSSSEEGSEGLGGKRVSVAPPKSLWEEIVLLTWRAKKKLLRAKQTHGLRFYRRVTFQKAWNPRPHHVSFSSTMWVDLTMVGVLFRLDEFFLFLANDTFESFWIPYVLFLAVYDAWEVGPLLQAEFRNHGISLVHSFMYLLSWLLLALMGATIPYEKSLASSVVNQTRTWDSDDQAAFSYVKLAHACLRCVLYADIVFMSKSKRARAAALPRLITFCFGLVPLLAAPILVSVNAPPALVAACFLFSHFLQRGIWNFINYFDIGKMKSMAHNHRTNMPFMITRFRDWTQLQLGACVLGLITEDLQASVFTMDRFAMYFVLVASYFFLASLDLLSYSSDPRVFHDHALIIGGRNAVIWFELFTILGLSLLGVAVGLRYVFERPLHILDERPSLVWLLAISSILATLSILLQQVNHHRHKRSASWKKRIVVPVKTFVACTCVIAPAVVLGSNIANYWVTLNLALASLCVLVIHALSGGFRREVAKKTDFRLNGRILAALIARAWLQKARRTIAERERQKLLQGASEEHIMTATQSDSNLHKESLVVVSAHEPSNKELSNSNTDVLSSSGSSQRRNITHSPVLSADSTGMEERRMTDGHLVDVEMTGTTSPLEALAASFSSAKKSLIGGSSSRLDDPKSMDESPSEEAGGGTVLETSEILRAIASFRKRSTKMLDSTLSRAVLIEDDDVETIGDDGEVSIIDQDKDIFMDDIPMVDDDQEEEEEEEDNQLGLGRDLHRTSHAPTIEEEDDEDEVGVLRKVTNMELENTQSGNQLLFGDDSSNSLVAPLIGTPDSSFLDSTNPLFQQQQVNQEEQPMIAITPKSLNQESNSVLMGSGMISPILSGQMDLDKPEESTVVSFSLEELTSSSSSPPPPPATIATTAATTTTMTEGKISILVKNPSASSHSQRKVHFNDEQLQPLSTESPQNNLKSTMSSSRGRKKSSKALMRQMEANKPVTSRVLKKVLNEKLYERPHLLAAQDVFAEYTVSWSDLFLDIIYVGVVYRLGDYLAKGLALRQVVNVADREPLSRTIFLFACLFYAIFSLWWTKLGFSSKCGVTDVFHKVLDICQGLIVLVCAANVISPSELGAPGSSFAYVITACLALFHLSMMFLWYEISLGKIKTTVEVACSRRNIRRVCLSLFALVLAFITCGLEGPLEVVSTFWALSWFLPILERFATINSVKPEEKAPYLLRYVLHRLGDGALILLGEGVFQIIRTVGHFGVMPFAVFTLSFINMAAARIALFQMDCFDEHAKKHAVFNSRFAHVAISFIRCLASPAIVGVGVALKLIVDKTTSPGFSGCVDIANYELLCACSVFSLTSFFSIYHFHRTYYFRNFRWRRVVVGFIIASCFLIFPWIECVHPLVVTGGCAIIWATAIIFHSITDDLFSSKDDHGLTTLPKSENDQQVSRRATRVARKSIMKLVD